MVHLGHLYCGARLQATHCTSYSLYSMSMKTSTYELKAAANESKTKSNVGKGIASPSLVPGAEERGKGVPGVYCWHMCVNSWNTVALQDISVTLTSVSQPIFFPCRRCILPTML